MVPDYVVVAYLGIPAVGTVAPPVLQVAEILQQTPLAVVAPQETPPEEETAFHSAASYRSGIHPAAETAYLVAYQESLLVEEMGEACRLVPLASRRVVRLVRLVVGNRVVDQHGRLG